MLGIILLIGNSIDAQNIYGIVVQTDGNAVPSGQNLSSNISLNGILSQFNVLSYEQAYPVAVTTKAKNCYRIVLNQGNTQQYLNLENTLRLSNLFSEILVERDVPVTCNNPVVINDPNIHPSNGYYIANANLPCAWSITTGNPEIIVAVVDLFLDNMHDDLQDKVVDIQFANTTYSHCGHGFASAGAVAAIPNNGICVAGSGNETRVAFYACATTTDCLYGNPGPGVLKAYADGHQIISVSFSGLGVMASIVEEIVASGVTIVHSTYGSSHSDYGSIPGVIGVGQVDGNNYHSVYGQPWDENVDIYAPCMNIVRLQANNTCSEGYGATSFGAPLVAGIVALTKSINPYLCPDDIEYILETTNQSFPVNKNEFPLMTQGIIDAEAAVILAKGPSGELPQSATWNGTVFINSDVVVPAGVVLTINGSVKFSPGISLTIKPGGLVNLYGTLTNAGCAEGGPWSGIKIEGIFNESQYTNGKHGRLNTYPNNGLKKD